MTPGTLTTTLDYAALRDALADAGVVVTLAELHGGVCAALCAGGPVAAVRWLADCLADQEPSGTPELEAMLNEIVDASWRVLDDGELAFAPLLPDDDAPLDEQVQALASWCHGFLGGLGASAPDVGRRQVAAAPASVAVAETLADFAEISRAGLSDEEAAGRDQPDFALAELVEYVRVSVQVVFDELVPRRAAASDAH